MDTIFNPQLYTEISEVKTPAQSLFEIVLNPEHEIYKGHFPNKPITPGVCILEIAMELAAACIDRKLTLRTAKNIKFLHKIQPDENPRLSFQIQYVENSSGTYQINSTVYHESLIFAKLNFELI